jgi:DNA-binding XRE family transcriptional regulator
MLPLSLSNISSSDLRQSIMPPLQTIHERCHHVDVSSRFGARLRELRKDRNLTQLRMAVDFGIDRTFISDVERGRKSITLPFLEVLAIGLNLSLSELLDGL